MGQSNFSKAAKDMKIINAYLTVFPNIHLNIPFTPPGLEKVFEIWKLSLLSFKKSPKSIRNWIYILPKIASTTMQQKNDLIFTDGFCAMGISFGCSEHLYWFEWFE